MQNETTKTETQQTTAARFDELLDELEAATVDLDLAKTIIDEMNTDLQTNIVIDGSPESENQMLKLARRQPALSAFAIIAFDYLKKAIVAVDRVIEDGYKLRF